MKSTEDFIVQNLAIYSALGLALRFILYGLPLLELVWMYVSLSFLVGVGGAVIALGREYNRKNYYVIGIIFAFVGLLPLHWVF